MQLRVIAVVSTIAVLGTVALSAAQSVPMPMPTPIVVPTLPPQPSGATAQIINAAAGVINGILTRARINNADTVRGTVSYFKHFNMEVQTGPNSYRSVRLHQGTVIYPRGGTPSAGSFVDVNGNGLADGSLDANTITITR